MGVCAVLRLVNAMRPPVNAIINNCHANYTQNVLGNYFEDWIIFISPMIMSTGFPKAFVFGRTENKENLCVYEMKREGNRPT